MMEKRLPDETLDNAIEVCKTSMETCLWRGIHRDRNCRLLLSLWTGY